MVVVDALTDPSRDNHDIASIYLLRFIVADLDNAAPGKYDITLLAAVKSVPSRSFARFKSCSCDGKLWILLGIRNLNDVAAFFEEVFLRFIVAFYVISQRDDSQLNKKCSNSDR